MAEKIDISDIKQRHPYCEQDRCDVCMEDHWRIMEFFRQETGNSYEDHLGRFRSMLDRKKIPAETEHGWATPVWFEPETLQSYLDNWFGEE